MDTFVPWSPLHAGVLVAIAAIVALAVAVRRRAPDATARRVERVVGVGYVVMWIGTFAWLRSRSGFDPSTEWPLQLCHWTAVCAALALIDTWRPWRTLAWYWGLALCTQALVTPSLVEGPTLWPFWFFWTTHAMTVGVPLYDALARGFRPTWRDFALASAAAVAYVAIVLPIDLATGWNYGFVGPSRPTVPTIVDVLGPWPERLAAIALIAAAAMALTMLPWLRSPRPTRTPAPSRPAHRA